ncbi:hypothetical protein BS50DRAFT_109322 [Corynespora cassiicola Philippines]|uniref:Uncharacterized protein n=1 Tax=Corynespora cassiicola Philippines TaxID=1448308 RepID=A0A2T2ND57_CORCC|nr:hypothetical protein BS50DRAFT_109322 [Corynespora cassiicola Philippines]
MLKRFQNPIRTLPQLESKHELPQIMSFPYPHLNPVSAVPLSSSVWTFPIENLGPRLEYFVIAWQMTFSSFSAMCRPECPVPSLIDSISMDSAESGVLSNETWVPIATGIDLPPSLKGICAPTANCGVSVTRTRRTTVDLVCATTDTALARQQMAKVAIDFMVTCRRLVIEGISLVRPLLYPPESNANHATSAGLYAVSQELLPTPKRNNFLVLYAPSQINGSAI